MSPEFGPRPTADSTDTTEAGAAPRCCHGRAPWPVAAAAVGGAFWLFPPLGIAGLAYLAMRHRHGHRHGHGCGEGMPPWAGRGFGRFGGRGRRYGASGNVAFDEARAEAWRQLEQEAEAFDDFRRRERVARDRDVFERFRAERTAPVKPEAGAPEA